MSMGQRPAPKRHQAKVRAERRGRGQQLLAWMEQNAIDRNANRRETRASAKPRDDRPAPEVLVEARPSLRAWRRQRARDAARAAKKTRRDEARVRRTGTNTKSAAVDERTQSDGAPAVDPRGRKTGRTATVARSGRGTTDPAPATTTSLGRLPRGMCSVCGGSVPVRRNGTAREHRSLVAGGARPTCEGSGREVKS